MSEPPKTLADLPAPDEATCRRLLVLLGAVDKPSIRRGGVEPTPDVISEPLEVRLSHE